MVTSISAPVAREITFAAYAIVTLLVAQAGHLDMPWLAAKPTPATFLDGLIQSHKELL